MQLEVVLLDTESVRLSQGLHHRGRIETVPKDATVQVSPAVPDTGKAAPDQVGGQNPI